MQRILQLFSRALRLSLVVGLLCCTAATARAQGGGEPINLNATLTVTLTERPATAVLDEITRKTGIKFAYDPEDIRRLPAVSGEFKKVTVHELLDKCIAGSTFKYAIENNVVLVYDSTVKMRKFTVSGTVRDAGKTVLPGASVILKGGSGQGISTDEKGQFTFTFSTKTSPAVLEVGFLGMETQQVIITGSAKGLNVTLKEGGTRIDDVVVNGMFTRNKSTYTGSVTSIKGEDLVAISNTNLMSALSAVTPGMVVVQNNALGSNPNAIPEILIRGSNSIATSAEEKAYNNPLIILDGAEISMEELYDLDMYEIERIDVLKDAQASIVYGDRAANGVIVIERQQVTDSKPRLSYNFVPELSIPDLSSMNLCNAAQKLELERLAGLYESDNGAMDKAYAYKLQNVRRGVNTDWIRAPLRVPFSHTHSLSLSGRAQKIDYRASLRFSDKYGVMKGDNRRNYTLNFSIGYHMRDKLTLRYTANYTLTDATDSPYGKFSAYTKLNPYESPYDEYGELVKAFYFDPEDTSTTSEGYQANPLYNATLSSFSTSRNQTLRNTVDAKWYVTKDFYVSGQFNIDVKSSQSDKYVSPDDAQFLGENDPAKRGLYGLGTGKAFNYDGKIVLNYGRNIGQEGSGFVINAGSDIQHTNATTSYITAMGFLKDNLSDIKYALGYDSSNLPSGTETLLAKVGFFASGNIYFRNRYFADVSYRTSGSSAYGKENRFAPMWSFGLGWNLHKEKFLENVEWIDVIRLKWSWGYNGQTTGSPYQAITTYKYSNSNIYYTGVGTVPIRMGNPELKWQRVLKNNFGINLTLFKERLVMSFDYFRNTTKDHSPPGVDRFRGHRRELRREPERRLRLLGGGAGDPQQELGVDERHQRFARQGPHQADQRQAEEHRLSARRGQPAETALPGRRLAVRHLRRAFGRHRPRHGTGNLHQQKRRIHLQVRRRGRGGRGQHAAQTARHVAQHAALQGMVAELRLQLHLRRRHLQQNPLGEGGRHRPALQRRRTRLYGPLEEPGRPVALPRHQGAAFDDPAQLGAFRGAAQRTVAFERDAHLRVPAEIPQTARIQAPGRRCRRIGHRTLLDRQVRTRYELPLLPHHQPDIPSHVLILPRP